MGTLVFTSASSINSIIADFGVGPLITIIEITNIIWQIFCQDIISSIGFFTKVTAIITAHAVGDINISFIESKLIQI